MSQQWMSVTVVSGLLILAAGSPAAGQDALGSGDVLDSNLQDGSGGRNPNAPRQDYRARNLMVTGNAIAGRAFRGAVGYTSPGDFRGLLGSDSTFAFRRDSVQSSFDYINSGLTFNQLQMGQELGMLSYRRAADSPSVGEPNRDRINPEERLQFQTTRGLRVDQMMRYTSSEEETDSLVRPSIVGSTRTDDGVSVLYTASSLRGLRPEARDQFVPLIGLSSFDLARIREDLEEERPIRPAGNAFDTRFSDLREDTKVESERTENDIKLEIQTDPDYVALLERIAARYSGRPEFDLQIQGSLLEELDDTLDELRAKLTGQATEAGSVPQGPGMLPTVPMDVVPSQGVDEPDDTDAGDEPEEPEETKPNITRLLRHDHRVKSLTPMDETRFAEIMRSAEQMLREASYLSAETRFERALRYAPGHPLARAGMGHTQIGAGLYLSATLTLRDLLTSNPEMIDVRYAAALLPRQSDLQKTIEKLEYQFDHEPSNRDSNGFLLAYLGHQLGERPLIVQGLSGLSPEDPLLPLLRGIWLGEDAPKAAPQK